MCFLLLAFVSTPAWAAAAQRIVTLAPHITENIFHLGAGEKIVGTVDYSDYPAAAKKIPRIGHYGRINIEALLALKPDLVIAWHRGLITPYLERLQKAGIAVHFSAPTRLNDIATDLEDLGMLVGQRHTAQHAAQLFRQELLQLKQCYQPQPRLSSIYALWINPMTVVGGANTINDALNICGGRNVFAHMALPAGNISQEDLIASQAEVIFFSAQQGNNDYDMSLWRNSKIGRNIPALQHQNIFSIAADEIERPSYRTLHAVKQICTALDTVRRKQAPTASVPACTRRKLRTTFSPPTLLERAPTLSRDIE